MRLSVYVSISGCLSVRRSGVTRAQCAQTLDSLFINSFRGLGVNVGDFRTSLDRLIKIVSSEIIDSRLVSDLNFGWCPHGVLTAS